MINKSPDLNQVRAEAKAIVDRLRHPALTWDTVDVSLGTDFVYPDRALPSHLEDPRALTVTVGRGASQVVAFYSLTVSAADAVVQLAAQLQDHAVEAAWGEALPRCAGHSHPLVPHVIDGEAVWECPDTPGYNREPIAEAERERN